MSESERSLERLLALPPRVVRRAAERLEAVERREQGRLTVAEWNALSEQQRESFPHTVEISTLTREFLREHAEILCDLIQLWEGDPQPAHQHLPTLLPARFRAHYSPEFVARLSRLAFGVADDLGALRSPQSTAEELLAHHILVCAKDTAPALLSPPDASVACEELDFIEDVTLAPGPDATVLWEEKWIELSAEELERVSDVENLHPERWFDAF